MNKFLCYCQINVLHYFSLAIIKLHIKQAKFGHVGKQVSGHGGLPMLYTVSYPLKANSFVIISVSHLILFFNERYFKRYLRKRVKIQFLVKIVVFGK